MILPVLAWAVFVAHVLAVKENLFKNCDNSGFCARNRHYAAQIANGHSGPYAVEPSSISVSSAGIHGYIVKQLPNHSVQLPFALSLLSGDSLRFTVDEDRSQVAVKGLNVERFRDTAKLVFDDSEESKTLQWVSEQVKKGSESLSYNFGPSGAYRLELQYSPVVVRVFKDGEEQVVINGRQFLNYEHHRNEKDNEENVNAHLESTFDMFTDSFPDSKADSKPLGPEAVAVDIELSHYTHAYGIPEHADSLSLKDTTNTPWPYRLFNIDIFEYETDSRMPMYGSIPLLMSTRVSNGRQSSVGVFWMNSADTFIDIEKGSSVSSHWMSENGILDVVVMLGETPDDINTKYGLLTGNVKLPQQFALGYHQCRWNYNDEADVLEVTAKMDEHRIPYDTIWLDIEYADEKKYFTWHPDNFPTPAKMLKTLDHTGRNLVVIVDPHIKTEYPISDFLVKNKLTIKDSANKTYSGSCWPGESVWIDSMNPSAQAYWDKLFEMSQGAFLDQQTNIHLWNDMNEPSFFNGPETSAPRDTLHYGDFEHRSVHNSWGKSFHELTYNSLIKRLEGVDRQRPFILTRSYFAGSQRTAAMWTGDNMAKWEYLRASIPMVLTSNVVNMPFAGADVGGFFGDPSKELLTRWYQTGIWYPFFRAHAHIDSLRREPWIAGEPYTSIMRDAVMLRYSLLPTLYTLFYESSVTGAPVWRPVFYESPSSETYEIDDQFFLGSSGIMVKPVTEEDASKVDIYIPDNEVYYDYTNGKFGGRIENLSGKHYSKDVELQDIPVLVKGGHIFARKDRYRRSSQLMKNDPYTLVVALDKNGKAEGSLYIDDGVSFGYEAGQFVLATFAADGSKITGKSLTGDVNYAESLKSVGVEKIVVVGLENVSKVVVEQNGGKWESRFTNGNALVIENPKINLVDAWTIEMRQ